MNQNFRLAVSVLGNDSSSLIHLKELLSLGADFFTSVNLLPVSDETVELLGGDDAFLCLVAGVEKKDKLIEALKPHTQSGFIKIFGQDAPM